MDNVENRLKRLLDFFNGHDKIYFELKKRIVEPLDEHNLNQIILLTNVRERWLIDGEGDPFRGRR